MNYATQQLTWAWSFLAKFLGILTNLANVTKFATLQLDLYTAGPSPTPGGAFADYTLAAFTGYAAVVVAGVGPAQSSPNNQAALVNGLFLQTGASTETVLGYLVSDGAGNLIAAEQIAGGVPFNAPGAYLDLSVVLPLSGILTP
jgi:hypothetical protein